MRPSGRRPGGHRSELAARKSLGWYAELIRQRIAQNWRTNGLDARSQATPAIVSFTIMRDGTIRKSADFQSSGNPTIDNTALARRVRFESAAAASAAGDGKLYLRSIHIQLTLMRITYYFLFSSLPGSAGSPPTQQVTGTIEKNPGKPLVAVPDFRAAGAAASLDRHLSMHRRGDLQSSPLINFVPKTLYPLQISAAATDLIAGVAPPSTRRRSSKASRLTDWSLPPVATNYLGIGYGAEDRGMFVVFGWLYSTAPNMPSLQQAQVFGKVYTASLDQAGAIDAGHRYAADILAQFGGKSLVGTRIVFVSDRSGAKEIWVMNWDGTDQRQLTRYGSISTFPSASPDGRMVAFTTYAGGYPAIQMISLDTGRKLAVL